MAAPHKSERFAAFGASGENGYDDEIYKNAMAEVNEAFGDDEAVESKGGDFYVNVPLPEDQIDDYATDERFGNDKSIAGREDEYRQQRLKRRLSPERADPFADATPAPQERTYADVMKETEIDRQRAEISRHVALYGISKELKEVMQETRQKGTRRDSATSTGFDSKETWDDIAPTPQMAETPLVDSTPSTNKVKTSRWDRTPAMEAETPGATPMGLSGYGITTPLTPSTVIPQSMAKLNIHTDMDFKNRYLTDEELDELLPVEGYEIVQPPADYHPYRKPNVAAQYMTPTPYFTIPDDVRKPYDIPGTPSILQDVEIKAEDQHYFGKLFDDSTEDDLTAEEITERRILALLLKIKNGQPQQRRFALRLLTSKAKEFGAGPLLNQILPLMMQSTLEDQERHLMVKVIDRILFKLEDQVRPFVHKILVVIEPLLIDEDYYARIEGREIISNLAKAAGLATMIGTMRPDIDHPDEYVRNTTARAFAVVASAVGIPSLLLFLKAVCQSKKSWQARHTGIKIVQQIAILMGCAILPHLKLLVEIIAHGLQDQQQKVRIITALALSALAEASAPYGIEAFDPVLRPLWKGISELKGKGLAAFLKAIGMIIPLMDPYYANYYTREVMLILVNEFSTPDEEMKHIVLKVVRQCVATPGVEAEYIKSEVLDVFFKKFWIVRNSLDKRNVEVLIETTVEIANKVGAAHVMSRLVEDLKDPSEMYRRMVAQCIEAVIISTTDFTIDAASKRVNASLEIDQRLEELLIDGMLYAFQEQASDDSAALLDSFGTLVHFLGVRVKPYLPQITGLIRWRLGTQSPRTRQQAADLICKIAGVMRLCGEDQMLGHLGLFLYEYLGEEYPEVLGSILGALKAIVSVVGMQQMTPPIKDLLPRLTPILKNRHEKVQENVIELIGRIADRGGDLVSPKEWDRICFDLLELLKAQKKSIRRATVNTFGYIARTIGPHDVLSTLLSHLKVQERQLRICTTIAIAIVAETCLPYSVLPAMMNEYRMPEMNVQTGILKAMCFMFEYIGEMAKDYIYAVAPLLEDALMNRDVVHRQTAAWTCKHLALGVFGLNCEDALVHLLNYVWPNVFETAPHLSQAVVDALDGFRVALGPGIIFSYLLQGLFHPAKKVRTVYWRLYNNLYIGHQDAMVPLFPLVVAEGDPSSVGSVSDGVAVLDLFSGLGAIKYSLAYGLAILGVSPEGKRAAEPSRLCKDSRAQPLNPQGRATRTRVYSVEINDLANSVHREIDAEFGATNIFTSSKVKSMDVMSLTADWFTARPRFDLMAASPPCQPYSRRPLATLEQNGTTGPQLQLHQDNRRLPVQHLTLVMSKIPPETLPTFIVVENIEKFLYSTDCDDFCQTLERRGYNVVVMLVSSRQIGFPNQRNRLYIVAKHKLEFPAYYNQTYPHVYRDIPQQFFDLYGFSRRTVPLVSFLDIENNRTDSPLCINPTKANSRASLTYDIVDANDSELNSCCCFTKNYGRFINGTGSVLYFGPALPVTLLKDKRAILASGHVRHFSPQEVAKLMGFKTRQPRHVGNPLCNVAHSQYSCCPFERRNPPADAKEHSCRCPTLSLPTWLTNRQAYALLGNSLNPQVLATILVATGVIQQLYNI